MSGHVVTGRVVKVSVGDARGNTVARVLRRGSALPEGVVARGLIEAVEPDAPADEPQGEPAGEESVDLDALNLDELRTYAAENGIDIGDATRKADIRAAIDAAPRA